METFLVFPLLCELTLKQRVGSDVKALSLVENDQPYFAVYNEDFLSVTGAAPTFQLAAQDASIPFAHEAGVYIPSTDSVFVTSNQFSLPSGEKTIIITQLQRHANGTWQRIAVDANITMPNGGINYAGESAILFCAQGALDGSAGGLVRMNASAPWQTETLLDSFHGRRFNSLNDVAIDCGGSIWFTDPIYGYEQGIRPLPQLPNQVYRFDPRTGDVRAVADGFGRPNGICFSPDWQTVYVTDTDWIHGDGTKNDTRVSTM